MPELFRIAVIGTNRPNRQFVSSTEGEIALTTDPAEALHWNRLTAKILANAFDKAFADAGRPERFQLEK